MHDTLAQLENIFCFSLRNEMEFNVRQYRKSKKKNKHKFLRNSQGYGIKENEILMRKLKTMNR